MCILFCRKIRPMDEGNRLWARMQCSYSFDTILFSHFPYPQLFPFYTILSLPNPRYIFLFTVILLTYAILWFVAHIRNEAIHIKKAIIWIESEGIKMAGRGVRRHCQWIIAKMLRFLRKICSFYRNDNFANKKFNLKLIVWCHDRYFYAY